MNSARLEIAFVERQRVRAKLGDAPILEGAILVPAAQPLVARNAIEAEFLLSTTGKVVGNPVKDRIANAAADKIRPRRQ